MSNSKDRELTLFPINAFIFTEDITNLPVPDTTNNQPLVTADDIIRNPPVIILYTLGTVNTAVKSTC